MGENQCSRETSNGGNQYEGKTIEGKKVNRQLFNGKTSKGGIHYTSKPKNKKTPKEENQ